VSRVALAGRLGEAVDEPGIKGTLFAGVLDDLRRLIEEGRVTPETLEARLEPEDLQLLEVKVSPSTWYDIFAYHRLAEILCDAEGAGRDDYWYERGVRAARRLIEMGIYSQLEYLGRTRTSRARDPEARFEAFAKDMKRLMSLHASMLNFGEWSSVVDPDLGDRYRVEIRGVAGIPDGIFRAAAGFFSELASQRSRQSSRLWLYERPEPDLVLFRMAQPV
jgi:hypothetical protein